MHKLKTAFIGTVFGAIAFASAPASAIPISDLGTASKSLSTESQKVVWVCGWYRCWWRPVVVYPAPTGRTGGPIGDGISRTGGPIGDGISPTGAGGAGGGSPPRAIGVARLFTASGGASRRFHPPHRLRLRGNVAVLSVIL